MLRGFFLRNIRLVDTGMNETARTEELAYDIDFH